MPRSSPYQGDFISGEIAPLAYGKVQEERYKKGLARCYNAIPTLEGGIFKRGGSRVVWQTVTANGLRVYPFKFSSTSAILIQFTPGFINFFTRSGPTLSGGIPYFVASPYSGSDIPSLGFAQNKDTLYITCPGKAVMKLTYFSLTSWTLSTLRPKDGPYGPTTYHNSGITDTSLNGPQLLVQQSSAYSGGSTFPNGTLAFRVPNVTPQAIGSSSGSYIVYHQGELGYLKENDTVYISGTSVTAANADWTVTNVNKNSFVLKGSSYGGGVVSSPGGTVLDTSFIKNNIPTGTVFDSVSNFRFIFSGTPFWFYGPVIQLGNVSGRVYDFCVGATLTGLATATAILEYRTPAWGVMSGGSTRYPTSVAFHENRLFFGEGDRALIQGSYVGDYENFAPSSFAANSTSDNTVITDANAISFAFLSAEIDDVNWLVSDEKGLVVGTTGGPWIVRPSTLTEALTPTNISAKKAEKYPTASTVPAVVGKSVMYLDPSFRTLRELAYFFSIDGFRSVNLSEFYSHLSNKGISTPVVHQNTPISVLWCARNDGALIGITYDRTQDDLRMGWHQHQLGGYSDQYKTLPPVVESIAVMPSPDGTYEDVWMIVKRYINGNLLRSLEYMSKIFESFDHLEAANFLDCSLEIDHPIDVQNATKGVTTSFQVNSHGLATGDKVRFRDIVGLVPVGSVNLSSPMNGLEFTVTVTNSNNFTVPYDSSALTAFIVTDAVAVGLPGRTQVRKMITTIDTTLLPQLLYLEGETIQVLGDGAYLGSYVVSGGVFTLTSGAGQIQLGYGFSSEIQQLRLEAGSADGTSIGKIRRINEVQFMVDRTAAFEYGGSFDQMYDVIFRGPSDPMDEAPPLFSGISSENVVNLDYDTENQLCIRQNKPLPLTLLAIMPQQVTQDKS